MPPCIICLKQADSKNGGKMLPTEKKRLEAYCNALGVDTELFNNIQTRRYMCLSHFDDDQFFTYRGKRSLKLNALPRAISDEERAKIINTTVTRFRRPKSNAKQFIGDPKYLYRKSAREKYEERFRKFNAEKSVVVNCPIKVLKPVIEKTEHPTITVTATAECPIIPIKQTLRRNPTMKFLVKQPEEHSDISASTSFPSLPKKETSTTNETMASSSFNTSSNVSDVYDTECDNSSLTPQEILQQMIFNQIGIKNENDS
jgi:hypothetical protein